MTAQPGPELLESAFKKVATGLLSVFALTGITVVLCPLSPVGLAFAIFSLVILVVLYFTQAGRLLTLSTLAASAVLIVLGNVVYLGAGSHALYLFACPAGSRDCLTTTSATVLGRSVVYAGIPAIEAPIYRRLFRSRASTYFPEVRETPNANFIASPLEDEAKSALTENSNDDGFEIFISTRGENRTLALSRDKSGKLEIDVGWQDQANIKLHSKLSASTMGLFSTRIGPTSTEKDWLRAIFANELLQSLFVDDPIEILSALNSEYSRTGIPEDYARFATFRILFDDSYFAGTTGIGQRIFDMRSSVEKFGSADHFDTSVNSPWNVAFANAVLDTLLFIDDTQRGLAGVSIGSDQQLNVMENADASSPYAPEYTWAYKLLPEKLASLSRQSIETTRALLPNGLFTIADAKQYLRNFGGLLEERPISDPTMKALVGLRLEQFNVAAADYLRGGDHTQRLEDIFNALLESENVDLLAKLGKLSEFDGSTNTNPDDVKRARAEFKTAVLNISATVQNVASKITLLELLATNRFQLLEFKSGGRRQAALDGWDQMKRCILSRRDASCRTAIPAAFSGSDMAFVLASFGKGASPKEFQAAMQRLVKPSKLRSREEFQQMVVVLFAWNSMSRGEISDQQIAEFCSAGDELSSWIVGSKDASDRVAMNNMAYFVGSICGRQWKFSHRRLVAENGLGLDRWTLLIDAIDSQRKARTGTRPGMRIIR